MRLILPLFLIVILISCQEKAETKVVSLEEDVTFLASDSLQGRATGTQGERIAADYVAERFEAMGLQGKGEAGYFQDFVFKPSTNPHQEAAHAAIHFQCLFVA